MHRESSCWPRCMPSARSRVHPARGQRGRRPDAARRSPGSPSAFSPRCRGRRRSPAVQGRPGDARLARELGLGQPVRLPRFADQGTEGREIHSEVQLFNILDILAASGGGVNRPARLHQRHGRLCGARRGSGDLYEELDAHVRAKRKSGRRICSPSSATFRGSRALGVPCKLPPRARASARRDAARFKGVGALRMQSARRRR